MKQQRNPYSLETAIVNWGDDGVPTAATYGDVYFSRDNGLEESRYVFLQHNRLAERWAQLDPSSSGHFTIFETGFGSGLNFLLSCQLWQQVAPKNWRLHYIAVEKHPMKPADLATAHAHWPELSDFAAILQQNYPPLIPGIHRRWLQPREICLDLLFGDLQDYILELADADWWLRQHALNLGFEQCPQKLPALDQRKEIKATPRVDAWFLDGFAPASNPEMWQEPLYTGMASLSDKGSSFATFTSAGIVKRGLRAAGFKVEKVKGYGRKREMLCGEWLGLERETDPSASDKAEVAGITAPALPWHCPSPKGQLRHVAIIGAGLAGCSTANALAKRGYRVTVIEREAGPAQGASGNPQGMLYTKLSPEPGPLNHFTLSSFLFALHYYRGVLHIEHPPLGDLCGVLQIAEGPRDEEQFALLAGLLAEQNWMEYLPAFSDDALERFGLSNPRAALFYPGAGWLSPPSLCEYWLRNPKITLICESEALSLQQQEQSQHWTLLDRTGKAICTADAVVIANATDALQLEQTTFLPLRPIRGQISYLPSTALNREIKTVICHDGYLAPAVGGQYSIGASFDLKNTHCDVIAADHAWNLQQLRKLLPDVCDVIELSGGRAALRCASPDYLPIVGALPIPAEFDRDYGRLRKDAKQAISTPGVYHNGLFVNLAHGSRGLTSTPLCAELLASYIGGELRPLPRSLCEHLSPARFLIRDLMRNRR